MVSKSGLVFAGTLLAGGIAVALATVGGSPEQRNAFSVASTPDRTITPIELAEWIVGGERDLTVLDLRPPERYEAKHIAGAINCGHCHADRDEGRHAAEAGNVNLAKKLVLYTQTNTEAVSLPLALQENQHIYRLAGGFDAWQEQVLAPVTFGDEANAEILNAKRKREALRAHFSGERPTAQPAKLSATAKRRKPASHKPGGANEGC